ncbi:TonB-dependent receptor [Hyphomonas sp.]|uniref:TonB-dependent receptor n=1 Tax=Hyphomonas sp. TaxID=87 RepID=UPI0025C737FF|nr:TonB-dependent receptor [Hyphomonas sp.]MBI1401355.1 TonB-dependent receptor plug domain-containing protein [Hyphomonas sp.]
MTRFTDSKYVLLAGASVLAMSFFGQAAFAQEEDAPDDARRLGTVTVTTQKVEQSIQDVPIAVSAFDEEALNKMQLAGGPDLVKSIPNVSFTKGNFAGYNFKVRGIGNDAVAQSGDAGVGVHQNDVPLTSNALFEAEFFDMERIEVLRGPQGTLYGRNATGGVFNAITAKPVMEEWQGNVSATLGNFGTMKYKGMLNVPLGDKLAVRVAGSYLERDGFAENTVTGNDIDSRKLYGIRASVAYEPTDRFRALAIYDYFKEDDSRIRSGKQLCKKDPGFSSYAGIAVTPLDQLVTSLGCQEAALSDSYDRVNSQGTLGGGLAIIAGLLNGDAYTAPMNPNLRQIESAFDPSYEAEQTLFTGKLEFDLTDSLLLTYLGSYSKNSVLSREDYNKIAPTTTFNTTAGPFAAAPPLYGLLFPGGNVSDPQLGSSNIFRTFDQSGGESEQKSHELRLQSSYDGAFNFNLGAIMVDFEAIDPARTGDGYYVFSNSLTALAQINNAAGGAFFGGPVAIDDGTGGESAFGGALVGDGGNYFRSLSPYRLESFAVFGEGYYDVSDSLKATLGLRYTSDKKEQDIVPSILFAPGATLGSTGLLEAEFEEVTGRFGFDWAPDLNFSDDTLLYAFYSRGYKGGGINPPQPVGANLFPQTFEPEFINSYEIGTKNTLANGALQLNATGFYYDYTGYQITQIVNRTSANFNIDAKLQGLEIETIWNPVSTFVVNANLGLLDTKIQDTYGIDVLDRTNGRADLITLKNASSFANCVISAQGYATILGAIALNPALTGATRGLCNGALYGASTPFAGSRAAAEAAFGLTGVTVTYTDSQGVTRTATALEPIDGDAKNLDGNSIPGAPETTLNIGAEYTWEPGSFGAWGLTGRVDYYRQSDSFSRVYNSVRDELDSWDNVNVTVSLFNDDTGIRIEAFGKNIADKEVITGAYMTDDSSGLFTNIFLTEPRTYGVSVTKSW